MEKMIFAAILCVLCDSVVITSSAAEPDHAAIRKKIELAMGPMPDDAAKVPLDVKIESEEKLESHTRIKLSYAAEKDDRVPAYLRFPRPRKYPQMLLAPDNRHRQEGARRPGAQRVTRCALHLTSSGYVTSPGLPSFGDYAYDFASSAAA